MHKGINVTPVMGQSMANLCNLLERFGVIRSNAYSHGEKGVRFTKFQFDAWVANIQGRKREARNQE